MTTDEVAVLIDRLSRYANTVQPGRVETRDMAANARDALAAQAAEITRLRAERDAAWNGGAEAMHELAAMTVDVLWHDGHPVAAFSKHMRALPIPAQTKEEGT